METSKRSFLKKGVLAGLGALTIPEIAKAVIENQSLAESRKIELHENSVVLFQGDSITDMGRDRTNNNCNNMAQFGNGYVLFTAANLLEKHADKKIKIYNRGISGNKVFQLRNRWEIDCLSFQPDVLSILIGVNDYWHTLTHGYKGTVKTYERDYRNLLEYSKLKMPHVQLVICEPFTIEGGSAIEKEKWYPMFNEYREVAKKMAKEFNAVFVPFQSGFDEALKVAEGSYWASDGVHPDLPGRQLMSNLWLEATGLK